MMEKNVEAMGLAEAVKGLFKKKYGEFSDLRPRSEWGEGDVRK
jgi:hypothetical protein